MRVVALISGGKDSCYSMMQCVAAGHRIVALANLQPQGNDELDSFMFQTVGHEGIALYAEAMGLPLYRVNTQGRAFAQELQYSPVEGDEVEDLYELLRRVRVEVEVEGVACGAVLSDYQRLRVENVCSRLGLVSLAYLWRRDQEKLLQEMIEAGVKAVLIKVASMGLTPDKHLGKTIEEVHPELCELHRQYGINVCGEGGEYETFTLDCPLFHREIVITSSEVCIHSDDAFAPVAYLKLKELQLRDKSVVPPKLVPELTPAKLVPELTTPKLVPDLVLPARQETKCVRRGKWVWLAGDGEAHLRSASEQIEQLLTALGGCLSDVGSCWGDVVLVYLYLARMADYAAVNSIYATLFPSKPPARVCIQLSLPEGVLVRMEGVCGGRGGGDGRSSMHVQSISHWAPANIGPYSQAYSSSDIVFTAGQIGLHSGLMTLAGEAEQPPLSLTHVQRVLGACHTYLGSALCGVCYFTTEEAGWAAAQTWAKQCLAGSSSCPLAFLRVPALPRGACVEWHFIAVRSSPHTVAHHAKSCVEGEVGVVSLQEAWSPGLEVGCWIVTVAPLPFPACHLLEAVKAGLRAIATALSQHQLKLRHMTFLRIHPPKYASGPPLNAQDVSSVMGCTEVAVSLQPTEGFYGPSTPLVLQACRLGPSTETPQ